MSKLSYDELFAVWAKFVQGGGNLTGVKSAVADSWIRCRNLGLDPSQRSPHVSKHQLAQLVESNKLLLGTSAPVLDLVDKLVQGTGFIILLTDRNGVVVSMKGDGAALEKAKANNLDNCAIRTEEVAGTNAISLALIEDAPIQVVGPEHYFVHHHSWTCSAAPIHDTSGDLLGVLNMSGHYTLSHQHTLGMVVGLAQAIERELCIREKNRTLKVVNEHLKAVVNSISEAVIVADTNGIVTQVSANLQKLLPLNKQKICGCTITDLFGGSASILETIKTGQDQVDYEDVLCAGGRKMYFLTTTRQIRNDQNQVVGVVGVLKEKREVYRMVNRFIGSKARFIFDDIVFQSSEMEKAITMARTVSPTSTRVLLEGESGTGKELFAQAMHNASNREHCPFVAVNCSAIPRELIESELFGYNEGAFTGAKKGGNPGKFELADGGTLFLDEINSMPLEMQAKLLRALQQNEIVRVGGNQPIPVDVRIIAATNQPLEDLVKSGRFRLDLFYRLGVVIIKIPPLRERIEDIPVLFHYLVTEISRKLGREVTFSEQELVSQLCSYEWPGNVRELENYIERAVIFAKDNHLTAEYFPGKPDPTDSLTTFSNQKCISPLAQQEKEFIEKVLVKFSGNISKASRDLGISRNTLYNRIKEYSIKI